MTIIPVLQQEYCAVLLYYCTWYSCTAEVLVCCTLVDVILMYNSKPW